MDWNIIALNNSKKTECSQGSWVGLMNLKKVLEGYKVGRLERGRTMPFGYTKLSRAECEGLVSLVTFTVCYKILYPNPINVWKGKFLFIKSFLAWWIMSMDINDNRKGKGVVTSESTTPKNHKPKLLESKQAYRSSRNLDGPNVNTKEARAS